MRERIGTSQESLVAARFSLRGGVQGIGVRPAIARLAAQLNLYGYVANQLKGVEVHVEGPELSIEAFANRLHRELPVKADIQEIHRVTLPTLGFVRFDIRTSASTGLVGTLIPRDIGVCRECVADVFDPGNRRGNYAFASCTNCGPRYSVIESMPYERGQTSMKDFPLCRLCREEYASATDRRFHAQTIACPDCGPHVWSEHPASCNTLRGEKAIAFAIKSLNEGAIVAVKGLGGYQLLCDATNEEVVARLRTRKRRPNKPLAIMLDFPQHSEGLPEALFSPANPIVLLRAKLVPALAKSVYPNLDTVGVMQPTTPLHGLLLSEFGRPLIVTSGNVEGESLAYENEQADTALKEIADVILHHDRRIVRPIDDSVVSRVGGRTVTIRAARGIAPLPLSIPTDRHLLAVGGHQKVAIALSNGSQCILGPHVGDMDSLAARQRFEEQTKALTELYSCGPELIVHDFHPDYFTTRWAEEQPLPTMSVQHHHAHIAGGMLEQGWFDRTVLGVAFDGTGYGADGTIWGGEFLIASATMFERVGHLRPFQLPGGELSVRQPWRVALSIFQDALGSEKALEMLNHIRDGRESTQLARLLERGRAGTVTTSAGRLFDGVAALLLSAPLATYEGELAMRLEAISQDAATGRYSFPFTRIGGMISLDWRPMLVEIAGEFTRGVPCGEIAMRFHRSVAEGISQVVKQFNDLPVVFSGGCFQNRLLTELIQDALADHPQPLGWPAVIPPNDGGLAAGQLAIAAARWAGQKSKRSDLSCV